MWKNITFTAIIIVALFFIFIQNDSWRYISPDMIYTAIISTDGYIVPGQKQDFLVNIFKDIDGNRIFEDKANFGVKITIPLNNGKTEEAILPLEYKSSGKYFFSYNFPENLDYSEILVSLFPDKRTDKLIMQNKIPVKKEETLIVQPPENQIYIGDSLSFELASVDKKSGLSQFKIPVRVKLIAPSGFTTLNRIVTTDTEGMARFETKIHPASPEGFYTFVFNSGNFEQKFSIYIRKYNKNSTLFNTIPAYAPVYALNENTGYIFNLNCGESDALIAYGCPDSSHRQIEIWQNGKLHYYSNLNLEGGTISIILNKPLLSGCPALFKVWQLKDNKISSHEITRYIPSHSPNRVGKFLIDVNSEFQNTNKDRLASCFARKGYLGISSKLMYENLTQVLSQNLKTITPNSQNEIPLNYYENLLKENNEKHSKFSFYLVEHESDINYNKETKLILDTKTFLTNYLENLKTDELNLNNLLEESICRVDRFKYLDLQEQTDEIKNIESLIIPLSEIYCYLNKFQNQKQKYASPVLSTVNKMKNITFIPAEFAFDFTSNNNLNNFPMLDIKPIPRSLQSIQGLLHATGKVMLSNDKSNTIINLDKPEITIPTYKYNKLSNLRNIPLILEIQN